MKPVLPMKTKTDHTLLGILLCLMGIVWVLTIVLVAHGIPPLMASLCILGSLLIPIGLYWSYREDEL